MYVITSGDCNIDISRVNTTSSHNFVLDECLMFCMKSENCINTDYTYYGPNQSISVIDHSIISCCLYLKNHDCVLNSPTSSPIVKLIN